MKTGYFIILMIFMLNGTLTMIDELGVYDTDARNYDLDTSVINDIETDVKGDANYDTVMGEESEFSIWSGAKLVAGSVIMIVRVLIKTFFVGEYLRVFGTHVAIATFIQSIVTLICGFYLYENKRTGRVV